MIRENAQLMGKLVMGVVERTTLKPNVLKSQRKRKANLTNLKNVTSVVTLRKRSDSVECSHDDSDM